MIQTERQIQCAIDGLAASEGLSEGHSQLHLAGPTASGPGVVVAGQGGPDGLLIRSRCGATFFLHQGLKIRGWSRQAAMARTACQSTTTIIN